MRILALDQGTTSTRGLLADGDGASRIAHQVPHKQHYPAQGWVEHDAEELIANLIACIAAAGPVDAIGLANQGESCLAWDAETKRAISPVIVWQDDRTGPMIEDLRAGGAEDETLRRAGLPLDPYFSASKLAWLMRMVPECRALQAKGRLRLGTTDAFFLDRLAGCFATDVATASRTSLMALDTGEWDEALCALFGVPIEALPPIRDNLGEFGAIDAGFGPTPVTAAIVDQQAALYGHGCRMRGDAKITFGTGAFALFVTGDQRVQALETGLLPTVAWRKPGEATTFALDGGVYCASAALDWAGRLGLWSDVDALDALSGEAAIDRGLTFVPALAGLACPHWDRKARGAWMGLTLDAGPDDLVKAVLEGVALRTAEAVSAMAALVDLRSPISIDGGLSANPYFTQFLADALERPVMKPPIADLTALGVAHLAAEALGAALPAGGPPELIEPATDRSATRARFSNAVTAVRALEG